MTKEELIADLAELDLKMLAIEGGNRNINKYDRAKLLESNPEYRDMLTKWYNRHFLMRVVEHPPTQQLCEVAKFISEN